MKNWAGPGKRAKRFVCSWITCNLQGKRITHTVAETELTCTGEAVPQSLLLLSGDSRKINKGAQYIPRQGSE